MFDSLLFPAYPFYLKQECLLKLTYLFTTHSELMKLMSRVKWPTLDQTYPVSKLFHTLVNFNLTEVNTYQPFPH